MAADSVTDTVRPAIVAVHVCSAPVLAAAVSVTVPLPSPLAGETGIRGFVLVADHVAGEHPFGVGVTVTSCIPPLEEKVIVLGETVKAQAAACFTVTV